VGSSTRDCRARPHRPHVANTVLKDNDLTFKLRLQPDRAAQLGAQLREDVAFLGAMGVMDYSLLVGVHNRKFRVESSTALPVVAAPHPHHAAAAAGRPAADRPARDWAACGGAADGKRGPAAAARGGGGPPASLLARRRGSVPITLISVTARDPADADSPTSPSSAPPLSPTFGAGSPGRPRRPGAPLSPPHAGARHARRVQAEEEVGSGSEDEDAEEEARGRRAARGELEEGEVRGSEAQPQEEEDDDGSEDAYSDDVDEGRGSAAEEGSDALPSALPPAAAAGAAGPSTHVPFFRADEGGMSASMIEGPGVFYMGIIDILQEWTFIKKAERVAKMALLCQNRHGISVMAPAAYAQRFNRRVVAEIVEHDSADAAASHSAAAAAGSGGSAAHFALAAAHRQQQQPHWGVGAVPGAGASLTRYAAYQHHMPAAARDHAQQQWGARDGIHIHAPTLPSASAIVVSRSPVPARGMMSALAAARADMHAGSHWQPQPAAWRH